MLKFEAHINEDEHGLSSPVIMITETTSDDSVPIILPEKMKDGKKIVDNLIEAIKQDYKTVQEIKRDLYE